MVIVKLMGGMGNQMFQYAFGLYLAGRTGQQLKLDLDFLLDRRPRPNFVFRDFDLDIFNITSNDQASATERALYSGDTGAGISALPLKIARKLIHPVHILDYSPRFNASFKELKGRIYLEGYFQSHKYFEEITDRIKQEFSFREAIIPESQQLAEKIRNTNSVCVNVRRADFVDQNLSGNIQGFVGVDYYTKAVEQLSGINDLQLFVFSDDVAWCRDNLKFDVPVTFVDHAHKGRKFGNYLQLMTLCRHFIIPNSTFAWWAAWLSSHQHKRVIVPKQWYVDTKLDGSDIVPAEWTSI